LIYSRPNGSLDGSLSHVFFLKVRNDRVEKTAGLLAFVRTVESGSFTNASRAIGSSPSAVAKSVARLERRLGVRLLQRSTRTLGLTAEGSAYYERVAPLLRAIADADTVVQGVDDARGLLRVTAPTDLNRLLLTAWMWDFVDRHPKLKLELSIMNRRIDLIREGYDIAVRIGPISDSGLIGRKLAELPLILVASPDYIAGRGAPRSIDDLQQHACLRYILAGRPYAWTWRDGTTLVPDGPLDTNSGETLRLAALHGAGTSTCSAPPLPRMSPQAGSSRCSPICRCAPCRSTRFTPSAVRSRFGSGCSSTFWSTALLRCKDDGA
jgi:DNA-binding transcriptional LysR family regulator